MAGKKGGARLRQDETPKRSKKNIVRTVVLSLVGVLVLAYGACCAYAMQSDAVLPRTKILGLPVGGMRYEDLRSYLGDTLPEAYDTLGFPVLLDGTEVARVTLTDLHLQPKSEDAATLCYGPGHSGNLFTDGLALAENLLLGADFTPEIRTDSAAVRTAVHTLAETVNAEPMPLSCRVEEGDLTHVYFRTASRGIVVDEDALFRDISAKLADGSLAEITCAYEARPYDERITADTLLAAMSPEAKNASYDPATEEITEATVGITIDPAAVTAALDGLPEGEEVAVDATVVFPHVYKAELETCLFRDLLASYSTDFTGTADRINNVCLAANACNGTVLNSGDVFSYNECVGERTASKGYREAPAYIAGETVDTVGGGICQTSSTLYYACLLADLEIVSRTAHRYTCTYIPYGLDATVSWPSLDYKFRNNTDYPIKIITTTSGGKVTVYLYGTKTNGNYVVMTTQTLSTGSYETVYEETGDLAPGVTEVKQTPYTGRHVQSYRNVYAADGTLLETRFEADSNYRSRDKIVLVGRGNSTPTVAPETPGETADPNAPPQEEIPTEEPSAPPVEDIYGGELILDDLGY